MKSAILAFLCLLCPLAWAAQEVKLPESVVKAFDAYTSLPDTLVPILKKATDKESADKAAPELRKALARIYDARDLLHSMPKLTPAQNQQVRLQYGQKMREEWGSLYEQVERLRKNGCFQSQDLADVCNLMNMMIEK